MANVDVTRIAGNIGAMNALNSLMNINKQLATHQTALQTGKRINSAADDPAGYTIATKMMARSSGLKVALSNISDASNMLSVAEGGLSKMNDILVQMRDKAEQAASDTLGTTERQAIQTQLSAYAEQIDNIVNETKWNGTKLLDGTVTSKQFQTGADYNEVTNWSLTQNHGVGATGLNISTTIANNTASSQAYAGLTDASATQTALGSMTTLQTGNYQIKNVAGATSLTVGTITSGANMGNAGFNLVASNNTGGQITNGANTIQIANYDYTAGAAATTFDYKIGDAAWVVGQVQNGDNAGAAVTTALGTSGLSLVVSAAQGDLLANQTTTIDYIQAGTFKEQLQTAEGNALAVAPGGTTSSYFYVGASDLVGAGAVDTGRGLTATAGTFANMTNNVGSASTFKYTGKSSYSIDVSTATLAGDYMLKVNTAIDTINNSMSSLGSLMARLNFKADAVSTAQVNVEASYNQIMNANMAEEQMNASKFSILQQTATAMLAQANQAPQTLLSLFR